MTDEVRRLLSGYATASLTPEENSALCQAALEDDAVFAAMSDEQVLRDLLDDAAARAQVLQALEERRFTVLGSLRDWFERPKAKVLTGAGVAALVAIAVTQVKPPAAIRLEHAEPVQQVRAPLDLQLKVPAVEKSDVQRVLAKEAARPPKPAPAPKATIASATQVAGAGTTELRWAILRQGADGSFKPVAPPYAFNRQDRVRIQVTANAPGTILLSEGSSGIYAGAIAAGNETTLPPEISFEESGDARDLNLAFTPQPASHAVSMTSRMSESPSGFRAAEPPAAAAPRLKSATAESATVDGAVTPSSVRVQIQLRKKF